MRYRIATVADAPALAELRKRQLADEGVPQSCEIDAELDQFFRKALMDGSMIEWVAVEQGQIVATSAIIFHQFPPTCSNPSGVRGYITNVYTMDAYRRRGIATALLHCLQDEAILRGVRKLWLGASAMGRPMYLEFGFKPSETCLEMDV